MQLLTHINQHKRFLSLCLFYFLFRFAFLLRLPIFNDEAIYLDWGWREFHGAGLFYSLYDAKQPLEMWLFGIFEMIFPDPLFAGRFVSVIAGILTMIGLFKLGTTVWDKQTGYAASLLYIVTPLFAFFDRQALMESAITAIGVWTCYTIVKLHKEVTQNRAILLGVLLGIGLLIKSTTLPFMLITFLLLLSMIYKKETKQTIVKLFAIISFCILAIDLVLFIQPLFWITFPTNDRFTLSLRELLRFPFFTWGTNLFADTVISFFTLTPLVLVMGILGIIAIALHKKSQEVIIAIWFVSNLLLQILMTRNASQRYLVSFLPLLVLFAGCYIEKYLKQWRYVTFAILFSVPFVLTCIQSAAPAAYILTLGKIEPYAQPEYITGSTSGYGLDTVRSFLSQRAQKQPIFVGIAENSGNPESALQVYYQNNPMISVIYFDKQLLGDSVDQFNCISVQKPMYFISRDRQQGGLNKFFVKVTTIAKPYGPGSIGIYTINPHCHGKTGHLELTTQN